MNGKEGTLWFNLLAVGASQRTSHTMNIINSFYAYCFRLFFFSTLEMLHICAYITLF